MKLVKPEGQKHWHVEVETENGSRHLVSTECLTKDAAKAVIKDARLAELQLASKSHRLTSEVVTLITANRTVTVADAITEWEEWMKVGVRSEKTALNNSQNARLWMREMGLEAKSIGSIASDDIHKWLNRPGDTTKRGTRNLKLSAIRNLFRFCCIKRYVLSDPSQLVAVDYRMMTHKQKETEHKRVFTDDEIEFILAKCEGAEPPSLTSGFFRAAIILGRDLGLRMSDICNLEWSCFDLLRKTVTVWQSKTGARVEIPASRRVIRLLTSLPHQDKEYLFPNERRMANNPKSRAVLSMAFCRFFERIGFEGHSFHSLRASLSTTMANNGATLQEIAEALGQKGTGATPAYVRNPNSAVISRR